jgi:hypothetical protein
MIEADDFFAGNFKPVQKEQQIMTGQTPEV